MARRRKKSDFKNETLDFTDTRGNVLYCKHTENKIGLSIKIKTENRTREIGFINKEKRMLVVKRKRAKHLFRKMCAYGFNYKIVKETTRFKKIMLVDEFGTYVFPRDLLLSEGRVMNFIDAKDGEDYELQIFLRLKEIEQYEISNQGAF